MIKPCGTKHPLTLQGLDRQDNLMEALHFLYAKYDERKMQDHLVLWLKISDKLNYFDGPNALPTNTWKKQIDKDEAVILGEFATLQSKVVWNKWNEVLNSLIAGNTQQTMKKQWAYLFDVIFNTILAIDRLNKKLEAGSDFNKWIIARAAHLEPTFKKWIAYYKASRIKPSIANNVFNYNYSLPKLFTPWLKAEKLEDLKFSALWYNSSFSDFKSYYQSIAPNNNPFIGITQPPVSPKEHISLGAHYTGIVETGKTLVSYFGSVITKANTSFLISLASKNHEPHIGIMLSFLSITEPVKDELNNLIDRQYGYYLNEVLNVKPKPTQKDSVFLTAELGKQSTEVLLKEGSLLKGGKDDLGKETFYASDKTVVFNKAKVASLKSFLREGSNLYCGVPNTHDGIEAELEKPDNGWNPFGTNGFKKCGAGIALSGDLFRLAEGKRTIKTTLIATENFPIKSSDIGLGKVEAYYTSEDGWEEIKIMASGAVVSGKKVFLTLVLEADKPAIVGFNNKTHERKFYNNTPVLELKFSDSLVYKLRDVEMATIEITVKVEGLKQLSLVNSLGGLDPSKTFLPFGPAPVKGDYLTIGSSELFSKNVDKAEVKIDWKINQTTTGKSWANTKVKMRLLENNAWVKSELPRVDELSIKDLLSSKSFKYKNAATIKSNVNEASFFTSKSSNGFLKLKLAGTMGHENFATDYLRAAARIAKDSTSTPGLPEKPYVPEIESISVNYTSSKEVVALAQTKKTNLKNISFYHITPFGGNLAHGNDLNIDNPPLVWNSENEGEFYVGFDEYKAGTAINMLIQIIEGSSNPLKKAPTITWQYLENNVWKPFEETDLLDGTNGLIQSGIVTLAVPLRFTEPGSLMGNSLFWVCASTQYNVDAVCNIVGVTAQGFSAVLNNQSLDATHYLDSLPVGTIKKLKAQITGVKKINQPQNSFGGSPEEGAAEHRNRISKRSRHKDRSVQMLDYEQKILEEFTSLKQVRCLSHTKYEEDEKTNTVNYSESAPGNVTVITLPKVLENTDVGIKRFTPISTLEKIKTYLSSNTSAFTKLHVKNPIYYEVELLFSVAFRDDITQTAFYKKQLKQELIKFLSPFEKGYRKTVFQSTIHKSEIIDFIDEREYVDYLKDLVMHVYVDRKDNKKNLLNVETAESDIQVALLVSSAKHTITLL